MFTPTFLLVALPTWIVGMYLMRRMKQVADKEVKKQPAPIPVKVKERN